MVGDKMVGDKMVGGKTLGGKMLRILMGGNSSSPIVDLTVGTR